MSKFEEFKEDNFVIERWTENNKISNKSGPAYIRYEIINGVKYNMLEEWLVKGLFHNIGSPSVIIYSKNCIIEEEWWVFGKRIPDIAIVSNYNYRLQQSLDMPDDIINIVFGYITILHLKKKRQLNQKRLESKQKRQLNQKRQELKQKRQLRHKEQELKQKRQELRQKRQELRQLSIIKKLVNIIKKCKF